MPKEACVASVRETLALVRVVCFRLEREVEECVTVQEVRAERRSVVGVLLPEQVMVTSRRSLRVMVSEGVRSVKVVFMRVERVMVGRVDVDIEVIVVGSGLVVVSGKVVVCFKIECGR